MTLSFNLTSNGLNSRNGWKFQICSDSLIFFYWNHDFIRLSFRYLHKTLSLDRFWFLSNGGSKIKIYSCTYFEPNLKTRFVPYRASSTVHKTTSYKHLTIIEIRLQWNVFIFKLFYFDVSPSLKLCTLHCWEQKQFLVFNIYRWKRVYCQKRCFRVLSLRA